VWTLNRLSLAAVRKLKDQQGQYLWTPGIAGNVPNTILGASYVEMPDMPNIGANAFPIAFGDFKRGYVVVDRIAISFQADYTTGADDGLVVFRGRKRTGGGVRQAEAIRKLKVCGVVIGIARTPGSRAGSIQLQTRNHNA
jgi:HK97 family phage major capsid protein